MGTTDVLITGGAILAIGVLGYVIYKNVSKSQVKMSDVLNDVSSEQLVVDILHGADLTPWFKENNVNGRFKNVILYPSENNIKQFHVPKGIELDVGHTLLQIIMNESDQSLVKIRSVVFEELDSSFEAILQKNDGVIFIE